MGDWTIRPMRPEDVPQAERLSDEGFYQLDLGAQRADRPAPERRTAEHSAGWERRTHHLLDTDPGGCWVAEDDTGMLGFATSLRRELMWCLATYVVRPGLQGQGIGRPLLEAALHHGRGCLRGMLSASSDPRAVRRYRAAGFDLHPQMFLMGEVDRSAIPVDPGIDKVREGAAGDLELMDSLDRRTRGAAHGPDHHQLLSSFRLLVTDTSTGSGYAYAGPGRLQLLAASNRRTAQRLLWAVLADIQGRALVPHVTAANQWAIDVGLTARLDLHQEGYLALRGMKPPAPYVHHGALL
ncbi:GNAT family N-acetyltransferase [Nocardioides dilutus]